MRIFGKIRRSRKYLWMFGLWLMFSFGCVMAIILAALLPLCKRSEYFLNFVKAADRMAAAMLGFGGRQMLSTELTHAIRLNWMRNMLEEIEPGHCEDSVFEEGAYCRLKDHRLGCR